MSKKTIQIDGVEYIRADEAQQVDAKKLKGMEYCIIRTYSAGVWAGYIDRTVKGQSRTVYKARRLWEWWSEFTLSALAKEGQKPGKESENKYAMPVKEVDLERVIEVIPCSKKAQDQIVATPNYSRE